jgi:hypothetical protein
MMVSISVDRSAKAMARVMLPRLTPMTQVVYYDTYLAGLPFYLSSHRPLWLITHEKKKRTFLGNYYAIRKKTQPVSAWGSVILNFEEFGERWKTNEEPLLIIVKEKNLRRLVQDVGESPIRLGAADEYLLVSRRPAQTPGLDKLSKRIE